jgi:uncharacterized protein (DUF169 family)
MTNVKSIQELLGLRVPPIAVAFLTEPPAGLQAWDGADQPAGCAFWQQAQQGQAFYTRPSDHFNCAIGAYTHAIDLPPERASELEATVGLMVESGYIEMAEVPGIPKLPQQPGVVAYAPADANAFAPDVVLLTATPAQSMVIYEAALRAGITASLSNLMGRPTCAVLPMALSSGSAAMSLACAGNRIYTGLQENEFYIALPGAKWDEFKTRLQEIISANERMREHYVANQARVAAGAR